MAALATAAESVSAEQASTPQVVEIVCGKQLAPIESEYAQVLRGAKAGFIEHAEATAGYAEDLETLDLGVTQTQVTIEHAAIALRLRAHVAGPNKQVRVRDAVKVASKVLEAVAPTKTEAEAKLLPACEAFVLATAHSPGEELTAVLVGQSVSTTENDFPYRVERVAQACEGYATTTATCREAGGHPRATCTYEDGAGLDVEHRVDCAYEGGQWQCREEQSGQLVAVAGSMGAKLNQLVASVEEHPAAD